MILYMFERSGAGWDFLCPSKSNYHAVFLYTALATTVDIPCHRRQGVLGRLLIIQTRGPYPGFLTYSYPREGSSIFSLPYGSPEIAWVIRVLDLRE